MALQIASQARAWGAFSGLRVVWGELSVAPGGTARGGGGSSERWAAQGFLCGFFVQSPGRSRTAARRVRGKLETCVSRALAASALSLAILLSVILALASGCALRVDLDLTGLQRLRRRKEPLQLKRCRALSSAHDNTSFATEHCTNTMARSLLLLACAATALVPTSRQQHKRSVMRMGWGDPPVCEPRPRSGFCARCTPSTQRV